MDLWVSVYNQVRFNHSASHFPCLNCDETIMHVYCLLTLKESAFFSIEIFSKTFYFSHLKILSTLYNYCDLFSPMTCHIFLFVIYDCIALYYRFKRGMYSTLHLIDEQIFIHLSHYEGLFSFLLFCFRSLMLLEYFVKI